MVAAIRSMLDTVFALAEERGGWLGPLVEGGKSHDPWSSYRFLTCLAQWWDLTHDARVPPAMFAFAKVYLGFLEAHPLNVMAPQSFAGGQKDSFSQVRTEEAVLGFQWLLDHHGNSSSKSDLAAVNTLLWTLRREVFMRRQN